MTNDPIRTLDDARNALTTLIRALRSVQTMRDRINVQMEIDELYTRWPNLRGGSDEVVIRGR